MAELSQFMLAEAQRRADEDFGPDPAAPGNAKTSGQVTNKRQPNDYMFADAKRRADADFGPDPVTTPKKKAKPRGPIDETLSALGSGVVSAAEALGATAEMIGIPGGETVRKKMQEVGESDMLRRPEYLQEGTVLDHPERLADWRWWIRALGENVPNMAAMYIPGAGAARLAKAADWGAKTLGFGIKADRAAGLAGGWAGSFPMEAGSQYSQTKDEMTKAGIYDAATIERISTIEGVVAGTVNSILELLPFDNLFLKQAGADRIIKRIVRQGFLEGSTEGLQEGVNVLVEKLGHKPEVDWDKATVGRILEATIIGGALGAGAGGTVGSVVHKQNTRAYAALAAQTGTGEMVYTLKGAGVADEEIAAQLNTRLKEIRTKTEETPKGADALAGGSEVKDVAHKTTIPEVDAQEMVSYLLYGEGKLQPEPGMAAKTASKAKRGVLGIFGIKETPEQKAAAPGGESALANAPSAGTDSITTTASTVKDIALEDPVAKAAEEAKRVEARKKGEALENTAELEDKQAVAEALREQQTAAASQGPVATAPAAGQPQPGVQPGAQPGPQGAFDAVLGPLTPEGDVAATNARAREVALQEEAARQIAAEEEARQKETLANAANEQAAAIQNLAGEDPARQAIVSGVMSLSEKVVLSSVQKELGITAQPAGPGQYEITTNAGPKTVTMAALRNLLAEKQIANQTAAQIAQVEAEKQHQVDIVAAQQRTEEARVKKEKEIAAKSLAFTREQLSMGRTLSPQQVAILQAVRDKLTPQEIAKLDAGPAVVQAAPPRSLQAMGVQGKPGAIVPNQETSQMGATGQAPGRTGEQPSTRMAQVEAAANLSGEIGQPPAEENAADAAKVREYVLDELATQLKHSDPSGWVTNAEGEGRRIAAGGWISGTVKIFGAQSTTPLRDEKGKPVTLKLAKAFLANVIDKARTGKPLTDQQQAVHDVILSQAKDEHAEAWRMISDEADALANSDFNPDEFVIEEATAEAATHPLAEAAAKQGEIPSAEAPKPAAKVAPAPVAEKTETGTKEAASPAPIIQPGANLEAAAKTPAIPQSLVVQGAKKKKAKLHPLSDIAKEQYVPGNIVYNHYWNSYDKVLEVKGIPGEAGWSVKVQAVDKEGNPLGDSPRWHATMPDKGDRIEKKAAAAAAEATPPTGPAEQKQEVTEPFPVYTVSEKGLTRAPRRAYNANQEELFDEVLTTGTRAGNVRTLDRGGDGGREVSPAGGKILPYVPGQGTLPTVKSEPIGTWESSRNKITSPEDAAVIARDNLERNAQEQLVYITTDAAGKILAVSQHSIGDPESSSFSPHMAAGQILNTPGASTVWSVHNHPSGEAKLSPSDAAVAANLRDLLKDAGIAVRPAIAVTPDAFSNSEYSSTPLPAKEPKTHKMSILGRKFEQYPRGLDSVIGPEELDAFGEIYLKDGGIVLLSAQNQPVAVINIDDYSKLRPIHTELLREAEKRNATNFMVYDKNRILSPADLDNLISFGANADLGLVTIRDKAGDHHEIVKQMRIDASAALRRGEKKTFLARSPGSVRVDAPITVEDAGDVVRDFREMSKLGGVVTLKLSDSFDLLPEEVRKAAEDAGGTKDNTYAVLHKDGSIYLIRDAHATREQLEKSIFHEAYGHLGIFKLFGERSILELTRLYDKLGGYERMKKIADKYGVRSELNAYWNDAKAEPTTALRNARITAELMALIGQKSPTLMQRAKEVLGSVRQALRRIGFKKLAEYNDADLAYLLAEGKKALHKTGKGGEFTVLMRSPNAQAETEPRRHAISEKAGTIIASNSDFKILTAHPDFSAAKRGNKAAAVRLVESMVKTETVAEAKKRFGEGAIYTAPLASETAGHNAIPRMLAEYYAAATSGSTDSNIVQSVRAFHTGAKAMDRLISRVRFSGDVVKGGRYVLVDDVTTMGGTLAELANHIQEGGGKVEGVIALTNASRAATLTANNKATSEIERRFGNEVRELFNIEPSALTAAEAGYIIGLRDADALRNRAASARTERDERLRAKGIRISSPEKVIPPPASEKATTPAKNIARNAWGGRVVQPISRKIDRAVETMIGKFDPAYQTAIRRFGNQFKEFWSPAATLPGGAEWLASRAKGMGEVAKALRFIEQLHGKLNLLPADIKKTMFKVLDGQIPVETLPQTFTIQKTEKGQTVTEDMKPQELARMIRRRSDIIGQMMVDRGILTEAQFKANEGNYIHYAYAYYVLGEDAPIAISSTGKLDLKETMHRNPDLTMEQRYALGLIEDASIAVPLGMGKALTDIAKWDYLAKVADNPDWVWQASIVKVPVGAPLKTDQSGRTRRWKKMTVGSLTAEIKKYEEMVRVQPTPEVQETLRIYKESLAKVEEALRNIPDGFKQLPQGKTYGPLAGAFVQEAIYNDIVPVLGQLSADMGKAMRTFLELEAKAVSAFKFGKVAVNFPTAFRNMASNFIQINMSGRPFYAIPGDVIAAAKSMLTKDAHYEEAFGMGLFHTNWFTAEINDVLDEFRKAQGGGIDKFFIAVKNLGKYYGKIDDISKFSIFLQQRKEGKTIDEAAVHALKWGMDYTLASRSVKAARRHLIPFISYQYKIAPLIAESLRDRPWVLAKYAMLLPLVLEMWAKSNNDLDDEDMKELEKQLPAYVKKSGSMMILPFKTDKGQYQWINAEYFLPWGNWFNVFRDMKGGDVGELTRDLGITHPLLDIMTTFRSSRDGSPPAHPFFGKPIYNDLDHPALKTAKMAEHLAFTFLPSMLSPSFGAAGYTWDAAVGNEDRWGREVTPAQAASRWIGFNIVSVSPEQSAAMAGVRIMELKKEFSRIDADPSISDERKAASKERMQEKIAGYAMQNPAGVLPIQKQKGHDPVFDALVDMVKKGILKTGPAGRSIEIAGVPYKMTLEQQREYSEKSSEIAHRKLEGLVTSPSWAAMSDKRKTEIVSHVMENARKGIRQRIKVEISRTNREKTAAKAAAEG